MSYTKEVTLWCEAENCSEWLTLNNYESKGGHVGQARIYARRARWTYVDGKDYCKIHSTFVAKITPDPIFDGPSIDIHDLRKAADAACQSKAPVNPTRTPASARARATR